MMAIVLLLTSTPAFAQTPRPIEIGGSYLTVGGTMHGWSVDVSKWLTPHLAVVLEVDRSVGADCRGCEPVYHDRAVLGGARFSWLRAGRLTPSVQVLGGVLQSRSDPYYADLIFGPPSYVERETVNYFAVQPGAGLTVMVTPRLGVRMQTDLQVAIPNQSEYEGFSIFPRVTVGAVFRLGRGR
jgi:hypothetical protein